MCCRNTLSFISIVDLHFMPENDHYFTVLKINRVKSPQIKRLDSIESVLFQSMVFCFFYFFFVFVFFKFLKIHFFCNISAIFFCGKSDDRGGSYVTESQVQLPSQAMVSPNSDEIV